MGYESTIHVVEEGSYNPPGEPKWVRIIASYDLAVTGDGPFREAKDHAGERQGGEERYYFYRSVQVEGACIEEKVTLDAYGDPLIRLEVNEVLAAITQEFERCEGAPYRRLRPIGMMLEGFREEQRQGSWGRNLFCLHEGH